MALKVYSGCTFIKGKQVHAFISASSRKQVAKAIGASVHYVAGYWSITGNEKYVQIAHSSPGVLFYWNAGDEYRREQGVNRA